MDDHRKSKEQLIEELQQLRSQINQAEGKKPLLEAVDKKSSNKWIIRQTRDTLNADVEFIGDFDIMDAKGVNISEGGISFEMRTELPFEMQFEREGTMERHRAHLMWVRRLPKGGFRFGLKFVADEPYPVV